jgi:hypothetical protein
LEWESCDGGGFLIIYGTRVDFAQFARFYPLGKKNKRINAIILVREHASFIALNSRTRCFGSDPGLLISDHGPVAEWPLIRLTGRA